MSPQLDAGGLVTQTNEIRASSGPLDLPRRSPAELLGGALTVFDHTPMAKQRVWIGAETALVLINPDRSEEHSIAKFIPSPYHGTWRLKHYLEKKHNYQTTVIDFNVHHRQASLLDLQIHQPKVIGFALFYDSLEQDLNNIWQVRQLCPNSLIIVGGIEATARADDYISALPIHGLLKGEGELALKRLLDITNSFENVLDIDSVIDQCRDIPGWLFKNTKQVITSTGPAAVLTQNEYKDVFATYNINPVDYAPYWNFISETYDKTVLEVLDASPKLIRLITSNYCPYGCSFCVSTNFLRMASDEKKVKVVGASAQDLFDKCKYILDADPDVFIYFDDENFLALPQRAKEFCDLVVDRGLKGKFGCRATAQLISEDICKSMKSAGFRVIAFGAESWDPEVLKDFNKRLENDRSDIAIRNIQSAGIKCSFNVILFAPTVTIDGLLYTCDKILKYVGLDCNVGVTSFIAPYPGTRYFDDPNYHLVDGWISVPGTNSRLRYPTAVLPGNPAVRDLASQAEMHGKAAIKQWQVMFNWPHTIIPREVSVVALLKGVYAELGVLDSNDRANNITKIVERILGNKRHRFVRDDYSEIPDEIDDKSPVAMENIY